MADDSRNRPPLDGVTIVTVETMQSLPLATQLLGHLGARIIKIEPPDGGEAGRAALPDLRDRDGSTTGATFVRCNLNKESVAVDLSKEDGRRTLLRLVEASDVLAENVRPGLMDSWGLGYEELKDTYPSLIYLSLSGFGRTRSDPRAIYDGRPGFAPVVEAMSGLYELTRAPGEPPTTVPVGALGDNAAALCAVIGTCSALYGSAMTGQGRLVDISLFDSTLFMADIIPNLHTMGQPQTSERQLPAILDGFRAEDGYFVIGIFRRNQWIRFCHTIGRESWLSDERFDSPYGWRKHLDDVIRPAVEEWAEGKTKHEASELLAAKGVAAGPSNRAEDILQDSHVAAREMLINIPKPQEEGYVSIVGNPVKMEGIQSAQDYGWPLLGEHTSSVLTELAGYSNDKLERLAEDGVIYCGPTGG